MGNAVKKRDKIITYDRNIHTMEKHSNANTESADKNNETDKLKTEILDEVKGIIESSLKNQRQTTWVNYVSIIGGIFSVIALVVGAVRGVIIPITNHTNAIEQIDKSISKMGEDIEDVGDSLDELRIFVYTNMGSGGFASNSLESENITKLALAEACRPELDLENDKPSMNSHFERLVCVGQDKEGNERSGNEMCGVTFMTAYVDGENEVYFLGQYNENFRWYGECILNIYTDNKLSCIFEAVYNDGQLFSYRRVSDESNGTWEVADRIDRGDYRTGETSVYSKTSDYLQKISLDNYEENQMVTYDDFVNSTQEKLLSYYNGKTSNQRYNDNSGDAYLIKYFDDGEIEGQEGENIIRTFYQGAFVDGELQDTGYDAWEITREADTTYMYYEGSFSNNAADNINKRIYENNLDKNRIDEIIEQKGFSDYKDQFLVEYQN